MNISQFITRLKDAQVRIYLQDEQLKVSASKEKLTPELLAELKKHKPELIEFLRNVSQQNEYAPIPIAEEKPYYEASHAQKRLWATDKFENGLIAYNVPCILAFKGKLDRKACEAAFRTLVRRHELLRTSFIEVDGELRQKINALEDIDFTIEFIDLRSQPDKENVARSITQEAVNTHFNFSIAPLLKVKLLCLADDLHILVFVAHHIIFDGWSIGIMSSELTILYDAYCKNLPDPLPPLKVQYKDYTQWHHSLLSSDRAEQYKRFWLDMLQGELPVLALPTYQPRPPIQTFRGKTTGFKLSRDTVSALNRISRTNEATLFMTMTSILYTLLYKHTLQTDIIIGTNNAGRTHQDIENSIGYFIDALPIRVKFDPGKNFTTLLSNVKKVMLGAYAHQIYPFDRLIEDLSIKRDLSRTPIFDVLVMMQNFGDRLMDKSLVVEEVDTDITGMAPLSIPNTSSIVDLEISFRETFEGLQVSIRYNTDLFLSSQIDDLVKHFQKLIALVVEDQDCPIQAYDVLSPEETFVLLNDLSGIQRSETRPMDVLDLFHQQVDLHPDNVALVCNDRQITYRLLDAESSRLAADLKDRHGFREGDRIAILLPRSEKNLIAIIGILKLGAAYIALDPLLPAERVSFILNDAVPALVLTDGTLASAVPAAITSVEIESILNQQQGLLPYNGTTPVNGDQLAYVVYTSGSTGVPKGVMIERASLTDYVQTFITYFGLTNTDSVIHQASLSFDTAVEEIFPVLGVGGKLLMVEEGGKNVDALLATMRSEKPTLLSTTPLLLNELKFELMQVHSLKNVISGGDELKLSHIKPLIDRFSVFNTYGPSESTVCATFHRIERANEASYIGKPIANRQVYVANEYMQLMPLMCVGEICIGGAGLARGYLNHAELTLECFVDNPFHPDTGRLYRTGDLGRWLPNGQIEFMGRKDAQVKIRGYRIELNEIEKALSVHAGVAECAVIAKTDGNGDRFLAAFYVSVSGDPLDLKSYLRTVLPEYMIPSVFVKLDEIPATENGKVNIKLLHETGFQFLPSLQAVAPTNETEEKLVEIWRDVLEQKGIGIDDNFFEIGGHSLKAIKAVSRINQVFQTKIEVRNVFENSTIRALARIVVASQGSTSGSPILPSEPQEYYNLSHGQKGLYYKRLYSQDRQPFNMSRTMQLQHLDKEALTKTLLAIVKKHEGLRSVYAMVDNVPKQKVIPFDQFNIEIQYWNVQSILGKRKIKQVLTESGSTLFNLEVGPLFRVDVLIAERKSFVQFTIDHIAVDAWSIEILANDFMRFYATFSKGEDPSPEPLSIQVKDFAEWQMRLFESNEFLKYKRYWANALSGPLAVLPLPVDYPRMVEEGLSYRRCLEKDVKFNFIDLTPEQLSGLYGTIFSSKPLKGASYRIVIGEDIVNGLNALALKMNTSSFNVVLTSVNILVYDLTGEKDIVIGTPVTLRNHEVLQNVIGWFLDTLLLRNRIDDSLTFEQMVTETSKNTSEALSYRGCPFEMILDEVDISFEDVGRVFIHLLNFDGSRKASIRNFRSEHRDFGTPTFDLNFTFHEFANGIELICDYRRELFKPQTVERIAKRYLNILRHIVGNTGLTVNDFVDERKAVKSPDKAIA